MHITISGKDFALTPAIKEYVIEKIGKLAKFSRAIERIGVELDVDHNQHRGQIYRVEVWIYLPGKTLRAGQKASNMHEAIDTVYPKLERQIVRDKERKRKSH
ncbi:MAG: ribosome-associated translation inhibitor RaiA [Candidatus Kerfeldbacteria bacterium]|nr:ribosome-associated translation inhibitor RaiA [Candidatus Kerfeldbacteria bacterium]